jgi:5-bromo-4-chloroindolyl phosphate hydrolysis protein
LLVLDAFEAEAVTKSDILHFTGLSDKKYRAARKRLDRLAAKLSRGEPPSRPRLKKRA